MGVARIHVWPLVAKFKMNASAQKLDASFIKLLVGPRNQFVPAKEFIKPVSSENTNEVETAK